MDVNINSPVYYKDLYGIDNAVYRFTQRAYLFFKELGVAYERKEKKSIERIRFMLSIWQSARYCFAITPKK